ncbi:protein slender lobes [Contarinia nasturtii]|uniref:protein slender lobes n=1 Tax=Contarinia nasturtii TaxID=265458 RepID=UPI0012D384DA|nr:protein slender lobes [Contarinia nasturtii]
MDENQTAIPSRLTRSRRASVESPVVSSPRKNTRQSRKLKNITEKDSDDVDNNDSAKKDDDNDDAASSISSNSMRGCKVVLERQNFDDIDATSGRRAIAHATRSRRSSQLTEENIAAHSNPTNPARRALRSNSIASDSTEATQTSRRSSRKANTPKEEIVPTTPARRSSRLLSENEKATDSPAKSATPARRLRSNSVASEDHSPTRRTSSRLSESQVGTPKTLKTKVSKIKEPTTPRRASMRINKSIIASEVIDEESDEENLANEMNKVSKSKSPLQTYVIDDDEDDVTKDKKVNGKENKQEVPTITVEEHKIVTIEEEPEDIKPIITNEQKETSLIDTSNSINVLASPSSQVVLISTTTARTPVARSPLRKAQTPSVEPAEPMETSMTEEVVGTPKGTSKTMSINTPKDTTPKAIPKGTPKGIPKSEELAQLNSKTPQDETVSDDLLNVSGMVKLWENKISPSSSAKGTPKSKNVSITDEAEIGVVTEPESNEPKLNESKGSSTVNTPHREPRITSDFEHMDDESEDGDNIQTIPKEYPNKTTDNVNKSVSTPNSKDPSKTLSPLDVSVVVHDKDVSTPQMSKKSSKQRQSLNRSTDLDRMEVSVLAVKSNVENIKSATPKQNKTPKAKNVSAKSTPVKLNTPKSSEKTPKQDVSIDLTSDDETTTEIAKEKTKPELVLLRPPRESTLGGLSISLTAAIDQMLAGFDDTPTNVSSSIDEISESVTPSTEKKIDEDFNAIATAAISETSKNQTENVEQTQDPAIKMEKNDTDKGKDNSTIIEESVVNMSVVNETQFDSDVDSSIKPTVEEAIEPVKESMVSESKQSESNESESVKPVNEQCIEKPTDVSKEAEIEKDLESPEKTLEANEVAHSIDNVPTLKSERKSVQIMTPKNDKNQMTMRRVDTPFPDENSILEATRSQENSEEKLKRKQRDENREKARDSLKKLQDSWNKSIARHSLDSSNPIDALGVADASDKTEEEPVKKVVARNNWAILKGLVDSEDSDDDIVPETEEGSDEENEDEEEANAFVDDEAEEVLDYETGDSMDDEERREIEENEIDYGVDIGSEDSDFEEEDEYEDDGFIIYDSDVTDATNCEEEEEIPKKSKLRRRSAIIEESSSSDESDDEHVIESTTEASNDIESVTLQQVESVVVLAGGAPNEAEPIEGKKFATTYLTSEKETKDIKNKSQSNEIDTEKEQETIADAPELPSNKTVHEDQEETSSASKMASEAHAPEAVDSDRESGHNKIDKNTSLQSKSVSKKIVLKKRTSLPGLSGIESLSKAIRKESNRQSLSNLNPKASNPTVVEFTMQSSKSKTVEKENLNLNASTSSNVSLSPNDITRAPLNISSQEENNNQKASKKATIVEQAQEQVEKDRETVSSTSQDDMPTSVVINVKLNRKRKFVEIDTDVEPRERPKAKKLLNVIQSSSGAFIEEPMTPEKKNKFGFREAPKTPINSSFKIEKRIQLAYPGASKKRKSIYLDEDSDDVEMFLPRPRWQINTQFQHEQPKKRARKLDLGSTEIILQPVAPKKKTKRNVLIPIELAQYRQNKLYRADIPRQDARNLLRERRKRVAR